MPWDVIPARGRPSPEALFRPRAIAALGAETRCGRTVTENLRAGGYPGAVHAPGDMAALADLPETPDLAIVAGGDLGASIAALAAGGVAAVIAAVPGEWAPCSMPVLGPRSFGLIVPGSGLNASVGHLQAQPGKLAFVSPSHRIQGESDVVEARLAL